MATLSDTNTDTDRIARLEGAYGHLATKADVAQLGERMTQQVADSELRITQNAADTEKRMVRHMTDVEMYRTQNTANSGNCMTKQISRLETRMAEMETRMTWRLIGAVGVLVVAKILMERFL